MNTKRSRTILRLALVAVLLVPVTLAIRADTTVVDVGFGDSFTGDIGEAGVDTFEARFFAAAGTSVQITLRVDRGATLQPTLVVRDSSGAVVGGTTQEISWLPVANLLHYVTLPRDGMYVAEVGGSSGSGGFWAEITGESADVTVSFLSGTVTDELTGEPIEGVQVLADGAPFDTTDGDGVYMGELTGGTYLVSFAADGYESLSQSLTLTAGVPAVLDVSLTSADQPVIVSASVSGDAEAGASLAATVEITVPAGTTIDSITWSQEYGVPAGIDGVASENATVTLGPEGAYKAELVHLLSEPPIGEDELPPNVPLPPGEFPGGLQNRFQVVGINPFALEEAALVVLQVEVVTSRGTFHDEVEIHTELPWHVATGLRNVPRGAAVLLQGKEQEGYDWELFAPAGSMATLHDATSRNPHFTPDVAGLYELEVTDHTGEGEPQTLTLQVYAGTWRGTIVDQDIDGRPVADTACTFCHNGVLAEDQFTDWAQTGHAEIFTNNLNTSTHYGEGCFSCHTVGFDPGTDNGGIDEAEDYQDFLDAGLINHPGDNWTTVLEEFPETARLANIQCENCHGPQDSNAHGFAGPIGDPRVDLSSDVCATCHGEPLRHARFQQWQLSAHANYELAIDEGDSGNCSRCHTGNGFLAWVPVLLDDDPETDPTANVEVTWTTDEVHPQTCVTCHDPHAVGTTSGNATNATMRISGDTPPLLSGFTAEDVGNGAICMTCHNSRRGLRNDDTFDDLSFSERARAPHGPTQSDVLMGQNAYLVEVNNPGGHAMTEDVCVACHMQATAPPDLLSYNQGGSNHTFYADPAICAECHSPHLTAGDVQNGVQHLLDQVQDLLEDELLALVGDLIADGNVIDLNGDAIIDDVDDVAVLEFSETRGRQALTVTFVGDTEPIGTYRMTDIDVVHGGNVVGAIYEFADDALPKAGWNWLLFHSDGSVGVHNPFFANGALIAARDALLEVSGGAALTREEMRVPRGDARIAPGRRPAARELGRSLQR